MRCLPCRGRGVAVARKKGGYQLHGSEYKANATTLDLSAHDQIVRVDPVSEQRAAAGRSGPASLVKASPASPH